MFLKMSWLEAAGAGDQNSGESDLVWVVADDCGDVEAGTAWIRW